MRFSRARCLIQLRILAVGTAIAITPIVAAQAAECLITPQVRDDLVGKPPPALHDTPDLAAAHTHFHGQIVLGKKAPRALYHLPIFMSNPKHHPHNFQVVLAVSPVDETDVATARYAQERGEHPNSLYTAVPPTFNQMALMENAGGEPLRRFRSVELYRGHFEKPEKHHLGDSNLAIERVVYLNEFNPTAKPAKTLAYLLFGRGEERFMVHLLSGPPDYDQILEVAVEGDEFPNERLERGVFVELGERPNNVEHRLVAGEAVTCSIADAGAMSQVTLRVLADRYCEVGELAHTVTGDNFGRSRTCPPR